MGVATPPPLHGGRHVCSCRQACVIAQTAPMEGHTDVACVLLQESLSFERKCPQPFDHRPTPIIFVVVVGGGVFCHAGPCPANMMVQQILDFAGPHEDQPFNSSSPLAINGVLVDSTCKKDSFTLALWNTSFVYSCDSLTVHFSQPQSSVSFFIAVGRGEGCSCRAQSFGVDTVDVTGQTTSTRVELLANLANVLPAATVVVNAVPFTTMTISQFAGDVCPEKTQSSKDQLGKQYLYTNCPFIFGQMAYFDYLCANNRPTSRESTTVPNWLRVTEQSSGMVQ